MSKHTDGMANRVDPDKTAPDLDLHCLLRPVSPKIMIDGSLHFHCNCRSFITLFYQ